jgi:hypothetical protein
LFGYWLSQVEEAMTSHKKNGTAELFSNLQLGGGCASLEKRTIAETFT